MQTPLPQLELMRAGVNYGFNISCRQFSLRVRPLSCYEIVRATQAATVRFIALSPTEQNPISESLFITSEKLKLASTSDVDSPVEGISDKTLERLTPQELDFLWKQYVAGCERVNPALEELQVEQIQAMVDEVKKKQDRLSALIELSLPQLANICRHLLQTSSS